MFEISGGGSGFGDRLLVAWTVNILNFNNINCSFGELEKIVNCKDFYKQNADTKKTKIVLSRTKKTDPRFTILTDLIYSFLQQSKININLDNIDIKNAPHPIIYKDMPDIKSVDVAMVTKTGPWTPYRNWPYFDKLKELFRKNNISYIDLSEEKVKNFEFLNYVKKSKIYLGLETGASHYAAPFIGDGGLMIQSGYCAFDYWAAHYNYQKIENPIRCAPCWKRKGCEYEHKCMTEISPDLVLKTIIKDL